MGIEITTAIILDNMDYRETSRFVYVYTREFGRLTLILKGVRKINSHFTGRLEPFTEGYLHFYLKEKQTVYMVSDFKPFTFPTSIRNKYNKILAAFYVTEFIRKITMEMKPNKPFYNLVSNTIRLLNNNNNPSIRNILRIFEVKSIAMHGYKPNLDDCSVCHKKNVPLEYFSTALGGLICRKCSAGIKGKLKLNPGTRNFLKKAIKIDLDKMNSLQASKQVEKELIPLINNLLLYYFEREFQSPKIMNMEKFL